MSTVRMSAKAANETTDKVKAIAIVVFMMILRLTTFIILVNTLWHMSFYIPCLIGRDNRNARLALFCVLREGNRPIVSISILAFAQEQRIRDTAARH